MKRHLIAILILAALLSGCRPSAVSEKPIIVTSIVPMRTLIASVVGDRGEVVAVVPPGASPTNYEPTPQEMATLSEAAYYFSLQVPTERANILPKLSTINPGLTPVLIDEAVATVYPVRYFDEDDHDHGDHDPHIWLSPKRMILAVTLITQELSAALPEDAALFEANAQELIGQLEDLDAYIRSRVESLDTKTFIIYHPSYGYFADDYGLDMVAIESEGKEETAQGIESIVDFAQANGLRVIFHQAEIDSTQAETIAGEIGGTTQVLTPLDADYIASMRATVDAIIMANESR